MDQTLACSCLFGENALLIPAPTSFATTEIPALRTTAKTDFATLKRFPDVVKPDVDNPNQAAAQLLMARPHAMTQNVANSFALTMSTAAALNGIRFAQMQQTLQPSAEAVVAVAVKPAVILKQAPAINPMALPLAVMKNAAKLFAPMTPTAATLIGIKSVLMLYLERAPKIKDTSSSRKKAVVVTKGPKNFRTQ